MVSLLRDVSSKDQPIHSKGPAIIGVQWTLIGLVSSALLCRLYVRFRGDTMKVGLDDLIIVLSYGLLLFEGVAATLEASYGIGTHISDLTSSQQVHAIQWLVINTLANYIALFLIRLSIAVFILRMLLSKLNNAHKKLKIAVYICIFFDLAAAIIVITITTSWCQPFEGIWNKAVHPHCLHNVIIDRGVQAFAIISAITDILYGCLPIAIFWPLNISTKTKTNLSIIMLFTIIICICAIGKAVTVNETSADFTYANVPGTFWGIFEVNLGMIVACLPGLRQFYLSTRGKFLKLSIKTSTKANLVDNHEESQITTLEDCNPNSKHNENNDSFPA